MRLRPMRPRQVCPADVVPDDGPETLEHTSMRPLVSSLLLKWSNLDLTPSCFSDSRSLDASGVTCALSVQGLGLQKCLPLLGEGHLHAGLIITGAALQNMANISLHMEESMIEAGRRHLDLALQDALNSASLPMVMLAQDAARCIIAPNAAAHAQAAYANALTAAAGLVHMQKHSSVRATLAQPSVEEALAADALLVTATHLPASFAAHAHAWSCALRSAHGLAAGEAARVNAAHVCALWGGKASGELGGGLHLGGQLLVQEGVHYAGLPDAGCPTYLEQPALSRFGLDPQPSASTLVAVTLSAAQRVHVSRTVNIRSMTQGLAIGEDEVEVAVAPEPIQSAAAHLSVPVPRAHKGVEQRQRPERTNLVLMGSPEGEAMTRFLRLNGLLAGMETTEEEPAQQARGRVCAPRAHLRVPTVEDALLPAHLVQGGGLQVSELDGPDAGIYLTHCGSSVSSVQADYPTGLASAWRALRWPARPPHALSVTFKLPSLSLGQTNANAVHPLMDPLAALMTVRPLPVRKDTSRGTMPLAGAILQRCAGLLRLAVYKDLTLQVQGGMRLGGIRDERLGPARALVTSMTSVLGCTGSMALAIVSAQQGDLGSASQAAALHLQPQQPTQPHTFACIDPAIDANDIITPVMRASFMKSVDELAKKRCEDKRQDLLHHSVLGFAKSDMQVEVQHEQVVAEEKSLSVASMQAQILTEAKRHFDGMNLQSTVIVEVQTQATDCAVWPCLAVRLAEAASETLVAGGLLKQLAPPVTSQTSPCEVALAMGILSRWSLEEVAPIAALAQTAQRAAKKALQKAGAYGTSDEALADTARLTLALATRVDEVAACMALHVLVWLPRKRSHVERAAYLSRMLGNAKYVERLKAGRVPAGIAGIGCSHTDDMRKTGPMSWVDALQSLLSHIQAYNREQEGASVPASAEKDHAVEMEMEMEEVDAVHAAQPSSLASASADRPPVHSPKPLQQPPVALPVVRAMDKVLHAEANRGQSHAVPVLTALLAPAGLIHDRGGACLTPSLPHPQETFHFAQSYHVAANETPPACGTPRLPDQQMHQEQLPESVNGVIAAFLAGTLPASAPEDTSASAAEAPVSLRPTSFRVRVMVSEELLQDGGVLDALREDRPQTASKDEDQHVGAIPSPYPVVNVGRRGKGGAGLDIIERSLPRPIDLLIDDATAVCLIQLCTMLKVSHGQGHARAKPPQGQMHAHPSAHAFEPDTDAWKAFIKALARQAPRFARLHVIVDTRHCEDAAAMSGSQTRAAQQNKQSWASAAALLEDGSSGALKARAVPPLSSAATNVLHHMQMATLNFTMPVTYCTASSAQGIAALVRALVDARATALGKAAAASASRPAQVALHENLPDDDAGSLTAPQDPRSACLIALRGWARRDWMDRSEGAVEVFITRLGCMNAFTAARIAGMFSSPANFLTTPLHILRLAFGSSVPRGSAEHAWAIANADARPCVQVYDENSGAGDYGRGDKKFGAFDEYRSSPGAHMDMRMQSREESQDGTAGMNEIENVQQDEYQEHQQGERWSAQQDQQLYREPRETQSEQQHYEPSTLPRFHLNASNEHMPSSYGLSLTEDSESIWHTEGSKGVPFQSCEHNMDKVAEAMSVDMQGDEAVEQDEPMTAWGRSQLAESGRGHTAPFLGRSLALPATAPVFRLAPPTPAHEHEQHFQIQRQYQQQHEQHQRFQAQQQQHMFGSGFGCPLPPGTVYGQWPITEPYPLGTGQPGTLFGYGVVNGSMGRHAPLWAQGHAQPPIAQRPTTSAPFLPLSQSVSSIRRGTLDHLAKTQAHARR